MENLRKNDLEFLRKSIEVAREAREHGNHPFGAILVDEAGEILLTAENTVETEKDCTGHAETNLMRKATKEYDAEKLAECTLYSSTEPCIMCCGAIFWGNVRRVVFGLSGTELYKMSPGTEEMLYIHCSEVMSRGKKAVEVIGPLIEEEAIKVHDNFWS